MAEERIRVDAEKMKQLGARVLQAVGVSEHDAKITTDVLVSADLRGVETHGIVSLVPFYITWINEGRINPKSDIKVTGTDASNSFPFVSIVSIEIQYRRGLAGDQCSRPSHWKAILISCRPLLTKTA